MQTMKEDKHRRQGAGSRESDTERCEQMTYHIGQGYSVLGNYQGDVKGGFDGGLIPTGKSSASVCGLKEKKKEAVRREGFFIYL